MTVNLFMGLKIFSFANGIIILITLLLSVFASNQVSAEPPVEFLTAITNESSELAIKHSFAAKLDASDPLIIALKNASHTHDNDKVTVQMAVLAWSKMERKFQSYMRRKIQRTRPTIESLVGEAQVSTGCRTAISQWMDRLTEAEHRAMVMWNAWGNIPSSGFFEGSFTDFGSHRGCLNLEPTKTLRETRYCQLSFRPVPKGRASNSRHSGDSSGDSKSEPVCQEKSTKNGAANLTQHLATEMMKKLAEIAFSSKGTTLMIGSCWPGECSNDEIENITRSAAIRSILLTADVNCISRSEFKTFNIDYHQCVAILVLATLSIPAIVAILADCLFERPTRASRWDTFLEACSFKDNATRLFNTDYLSIMDHNRELTFLDGIKCIALVLILFGSSISKLDNQSMTHKSVVSSSHYALRQISTPLDVNFGTNVFFLVSGLVGSFVALKSDRPHLDTLSGIMFKYIRSLLQLVTVMSLFVLIPLLSGSPIYTKEAKIHATKCLDNFWTDLLYLQPYKSGSQQCAIPSWFLSVEMTFNIISIPIIFCFGNNRPKLGLAINFLIMSTLSTLGLYFYYQNSDPDSTQMDIETQQRFFNKPYSYASSYFIGLAMGYVITKRHLVQMNSYYFYIGWIVCLVGLASTFVGTKKLLYTNPDSQLSSTLHYCSTQILWPLSISWFVFLCTINRFSWLNQVFSYGAFVPASRLADIAYLCHVFVVALYGLSIKRTFEPSKFNLVSNHTTLHENKIYERIQLTSISSYRYV